MSCKQKTNHLEKILTQPGKSDCILERMCDKNALLGSSPSKELVFELQEVCRDKSIQLQ